MTLQLVVWKRRGPSSPVPGKLMGCGWPRCQGEGLAVGGVAPKVQLYGGHRVQAAIGALQLFGFDDTGGVGYGVVTLGSVGAAATIGYGYGYGAPVDSEGSRGVLFLGAEKALGRSFRLIIEGYVGGAGLGMSGWACPTGRSSAASASAAVDGRRTSASSCRSTRPARERPPPC